MNPTTKKVLKYTLLPEFGLQLRMVFAGGFSFVAVYLAQIYSAVRLLPQNHPYLNPANRGRFGVRHVVAAAAANLSFKKENLDQILIFFIMILGLVILLAQFCMLGFMLFIQAAQATALPVSFAGFFLTPAPGDYDIAFVLLDRVFGVPQMFTDVAGNSTCVATNAPCFASPPLVGGNPRAVAEGAYPWPFHIALRQMLQFYSIGLLICGLMIFLYFVVAVVMETAQDGVPFGRRFNHVWAPIRMVVALGLLIPVANGLNAAQYITLYAAKWGSGFATNGWNLFIENAVTAAGGGATPLGDQSNLVATPSVPEMTNLMEFNTVLQTCWAAYGRMVNPPVNGIPIRGYLVRPDAGAGNRLVLIPSLDFDQAVRFANYHDLHIVWGECSYTDSTRPTPQTSPCNGSIAAGGGPLAPVGTAPFSMTYASELGNVKPTCGEVIIPINQTLDPNIGTNPEPGSYYLSQQWYELILEMWLGSSYNINNCQTAALNGRSCWGTGAGAASDPDCPAGTAITGPDPFYFMEQWGLCIENRYGHDKTNPNSPIPTNAMLKALVDMTPGANAYFPTKAQVIIKNAVAMQAKSIHWQFGNLKRLGWGGAGIWYHRVAQLNGSLVDALNSIPHVKSYPLVMEYVMKARAKADKNTAGRELFRPVTSNDTPSDELKGEVKGEDIAKVLFQAYDLWKDAVDVKTTGNWVYDLINALLGTQGLFAIQDPANLNVQPLALLVGIGKGMVNTAMRNLAIATGGAIMARVLSNGIPHIIADVVAKMGWSLGMAGLSIGVMLYYIVPFMPFLYFFFAVGTWVKGLFEAIVGVPLWALAHIHVDGEGLPGSFAMGGYYMLMEIFLRPILIIFGLLASICIFSAQVRILNDIWTLVTSNLTGFNAGTWGGTVPAGSGQPGDIVNFRDSIDQLFFTIIYAIVVYMMCMASFKLIARIPDKVMRWMGANVDAFNDQEDIAKGLMGKTQAGLSMLSTKLTNAFGASRKVGGGGGGKGPK